MKRLLPVACALLLNSCATAYLTQQMYEPDCPTPVRVVSLLALPAAFAVDLVLFPPLFVCTAVAVAHDL